MLAHLLFDVVSLHFYIVVDQGAETLEVHLAGFLSTLWLVLLVLIVFAFFVLLEICVELINVILDPPADLSQRRQHLSLLLERVLARQVLTQEVKILFSFHAYLRILAVTKVDLSIEEIVLLQLRSLI